VPNSARGHSPPAWRPGTRGWMKGWLGLGLAARSSRGAALVPTQLRALVAWSPRAGRCGGTLAEGPVVAIRWQGVTDELVGTTGTAPGNESGGGARRGRRSTARRRGRLGTVAFQWRVALAIIDECGEVLQLEGDNGGEEMAVDGGDRRLEEALTDEWWMAAQFGRNPVRASILRSSAVDRRWGGVSGELVRPGKRRENGEKEGGHGGGGDHFKSAAEVGDDRRGGAMWRARAERGGREGGGTVRAGRGRGRESGQCGGSR
jgi:hypothetical protein